MTAWADKFPVTDEAQTREQLRLVLVECERVAGGKPAAGPQSDVIGWLEAQRDALLWLAGDADTAPLSGKATRATRGAVTEEYSSAMVATLSGDRASARARGVDRVLHWALGKAEAPMAWRTRQAG